MSELKTGHSMGIEMRRMGKIKRWCGQGAQESCAPTTEVCEKRVEGELEIRRSGGNGRRDCAMWVAA